MTTITKTSCANWRSSHFDTKNAAESEILDRKINDARIRRGRPQRRDVEFCDSCEQWIIVSPLQRENRRTAARSGHRTR